MKTVNTLLTCSELHLLNRQMRSDHQSTVSVLYLENLISGHTQHTYAHTHAHACTQMCIHTHTHTHMCMHTHTHICVRIHTHTQTHTCTCMMHKERKKETNKQTTSCKEYATVQLIDLN